jgi:hypothetical protein
MTTEPSTEPDGLWFRSEARKNAKYWLSEMRALEAEVATLHLDMAKVEIRNSELEAEVQQLRKRVNVCSAGTTGCIVDHEKVGGWCSDGLGSTEGVGVPLPIYERDL